MEKKKLQLGLIILIFVANIATGITPALAKIGNAFPEVGRSQLQLIISIAALLSFLASLAAGKLQSLVSQKTVVLTGAAFLGLGCLPLIVQSNFTFLLIVSVFLGGGSGLMTATIPALIARYFEGEARTSMLGKKTGYQGLGTMLMTFIGGVLAVYGWQYNYAIFVIAIIAFVLGLFLLPNDPVLKKAKEGERTALESDDQKYAVGSLTVVLLLTLAVTLTMLTSVLSNNMALHADINGIGDSSVSGLALSVNSLGTILAGFVASHVVKVLKSNTLWISYLLMAGGLLIIGVLHAKVGLVGGSFIFGLGYGTVMTRLLYLITSLLKSTSVPMGMSLFSALTSLGFALAPMLMNGIAGLFSDNLATASFMVALGFALGIAAIILVTNGEKKLVGKIV